MSISQTSTQDVHVPERLLMSRTDQGDQIRTEMNPLMGQE